MSEMSSLSYAPAKLSNGNCYTTTYSHSNTAPARMEDGRMFTDYRPRCTQYPLKLTSKWGEHDGRQNMIQSAEMLMEQAHSVLQKKVGSVSGSCVDTMVPELYRRVCTWKGCETIPGHYAGIGTGRIYVPDATSAASNPDSLAETTLPTMVNTYGMTGQSKESECAVDDPEKMWRFLDQPSGLSARATPYSAPRA
jgi:hypothetical protein